MSISVEPHPLLDAVAFEADFDRPLGELGTVPALVDGLRADFAAPLASSDEVRARVRDLLRHGGFKPTGRSKPASEYLLRAAAEGTLGSINAAVDACNVVSLHSGLPISVVDRELAIAPLRVAIAPEGASYVFNASGQSIDLGGLVCLCDAEGPIANPVKDAQRTKTHAATTKTLTVIWGARALPGRAEQAFAWYRALLEATGASVRRVELALG
jgi:DNA/RNA-binding domain of Phe-tRNA-synthetase-like protein